MANEFICSIFPNYPGCSTLGTTGNRTYRLTVENGTGSGSYYPGTSVAVVGNRPRTGMEFDRWLVISGSGIFDDPQQRETTFLTTSQNTVIRPYYQAVSNLPTYTLTVQNGSGSGRYRQGQSVSISADTAPRGSQFDRWVLVSGSGTFASATSRNTTFTMGGRNAVIRASYRTTGAQTYSLTVQNGSGSGNYRQGQVVSISADAPPRGSQFDRWVLVSGSGTFDRATNGNTTFTMGSRNTVIRASYRATTPPPTSTYSLTVQSGSGSGVYRQGQVVPVSADAPPYGYSFDRWVLSSGSGTFDNAYSVNTTFTMGSRNSVVRATYRPNPQRTYRLVVENGTGSGNYPAGQTLAVSAIAPPNAIAFERWLVVEGGGTFGNTRSRNTTFTTTDLDTVIAALFQMEETGIMPLNDFE